VGTSGSEASSPDKGSRIIGILGIFSGVFVIVTLLSIVLEPTPAAPDQSLSTFNSNQGLYALYGMAPVLMSTFLIPFAAGFSKIVRQKSPSVSLAAAFLVVTGVLTVTIGTVLQIASLYAISQGPSGATYATEAAYSAYLVDTFAGALGTMTVLLAGFGLLLFAWLTWKGEAFPRWLSYVLLVGGVSGILGSTVVVIGISFIFIIGFLVLLAVWGFGAGAALLRNKPMVAQPAK